MAYVSTRNNKKEISFSKAIINGISEDGGLYVLKELNTHINLKNLTNKTYKEVAFEILSIFKDDFSDDDLNYCINKAYTNTFENNNVCPISKVNDYYLLELYHGPTCAFKDVALSFLPHSMSVAKKNNNIKEKILILTATSGDTGKAALCGFKDLNDIDICVFYPKNKVSKTQELQMITSGGNNVHVISVNGNFDDCQKIVKDIFNDEAYNELLKDKNIILSSANSINISRLIPQIVYYFYSYLDLINKKEIILNEKINFVVPTGNFGNILAGFYAKLLGLPINKLIMAANENNVLDDFIKTGIYDRNRILKSTISPSMDILVSSNVERILYELYNHNDQKIKELMNDLNNTGKYQIDDNILKKLQDTFYSSYSKDEDTNKYIKETFLEFNKLVDPHTSCAIKVYDDYKKETNDKTKTIILSTASAFKFSKDVYKAIMDNFIDDEYYVAIKLSELSKENIPSNIKELKNLSIKHNENININEAKEAILKLIGD